DMIYFDYVVEDYVYANIFKRLDNKKMRSYLKRCNKRVKGGYETLNASYGSARLHKAMKKTHKDANKLW
ncbi:MAG: hypothetical protein ACRDF4_03730, partial [Rhabdochlamydiaceae bacterium]